MEVKKAINSNYLTDDITVKKSVNIANKMYIDKFVSVNYKKLSAKFEKQRNTVNSTAFGSLDKLNETLLSIYTDPELHFKNYNEAEKYLTSKFTEKEIRIVMRKPTKCENELNNEDINENN